MTTARGRLFGVGVGPGDPELMTIKALRVLQAAPVVAYFVAKGKKGNAYGIVEAHLLDTQTQLPLVYPVTTEALPPPLCYETVIADFYDTAAEIVAAHLDAGRDVAVICEGDPFFYGSYMRTFVHEEGRLPHELAADLGRYRRRVFVEQLGWELPSANESFERDQFDRDDTVYVFARNAGGDVCGCARLLPTTRPYLLQSLFADLIAADMPLPQSAAVWELSRFAATDDEGGSGNAEWAVRPMLAAVVECAAQLGARQLIGVTFASMERLFRRIGIHAHRAGPPKQVDGRLVVACWIDIDPQTFAALGIKPGQAARQAIAA